MATNNIINSPFPTVLSQGGTNAALTASNGGIFYSTASAGAILAGTATANQTILSGSSSAPSWSTATYPATTTANRFLYSSSNNVIGQVTAANSASLVTNSSGVPSFSSSMTNGQIIIGSTSGTPTAATLTAGTNISITNGSGGITINSTTGGSSWKWIATQTASSSTSLNFNSNLISTYVAYRLLLINLLLSSSGDDLQLRFGTGSGSYVTTSVYINQMFQVYNNGSNSYLGYTGSPDNFGRIDHLSSVSGTFGGICGYVDLFVTSGSSNVANGASHTSYRAFSGVNLNYSNTTSTFQIPSNNYTSVQLLCAAGNINSGSAYLYGLLPS